jgi:hypothetical protein
VIEMTGGEATNTQTRPVANPAARFVRVAAHCGIVFLALILARDLSNDDGVPLWPDKGFGLLVIALSLLTAVPAIIRALRMSAPKWGENLAGHLGRAARLRLFAFGLIWLAYGFFLPLLGFLVTATIAISVSAIAIGRARPWIAVPVAALISVLVFFIFQRVLYVGLPLGPLDRVLIENLPRG